MSNNPLSNMFNNQLFNKLFHNHKKLSNNNPLFNKLPKLLDNYLNKSPMVKELLNSLLLKKKKHLKLKLELNTLLKIELKWNTKLLKEEQKFQFKKFTPTISLLKLKLIIFQLTLINTLLNTFHKKKPTLSLNMFQSKKHIQQLNMLQFKKFHKVLNIKLVKNHSLEKLDKKNTLLLKKLSVKQEFLNGLNLLSNKTIHY